MFKEKDAEFSLAIAFMVFNLMFDPLYSRGLSAGNTIVIMKTSLFDRRQSQVQIQWGHSALPNVFSPTTTGSEAIQTYKFDPEEASSCTLYQFYNLF